MNGCRCPHAPLRTAPNPARKFRLVSLCSDRKRTNGHHLLSVVIFLHASVIHSGPRCVIIPSRSRSPRVTSRDHPRAPPARPGSRGLMRLRVLCGRRMDQPRPRGTPVAASTPPGPAATFAGSRQPAGIDSLAADDAGGLRTPCNV